MRLVVGAVLVIAIAGCGSGHERASTCARAGNHWYGEALLHVPPGRGPRALLVAFRGGGQSGGAPLGPYAQLRTYTGCAAGLRVQHIVIRGDPHYWYEHSNERVWRFLSRLPANAAR